MPYKGYTAITVKRELYEALRQVHAARYSKAHVKPSLSAYVSTILWEVLEQERAPHRSKPREAA